MSGSLNKGRTEAQIAAAKRNLKPFKKGQPTINPAGRPKGIVQLAKEAADRCNPLQFLAEVVAGQHRAQMRDRIVAAKEILDRAYGRPVDSQVQLQLTGSGPDSPAQLGAALESLARLFNERNAAALPETVDAEIVQPSGELAANVAAVSTTDEPKDP
jgi:hypothetical protein